MQKCSRNDGMTERRNHGTTEGQGESSIAPLFQSGAIISSSGHAISLTAIIFSFQPKMMNLTHLSLASLLWDIGKQNSPRCDAAERGVPSGAILFA